MTRNSEIDSFTFKQKRSPKWKTNWQDFLKKSRRKITKLHRNVSETIGTEFPGGTLELLKRSGKDIVVHCWETGTVSVRTGLLRQIRDGRFVLTIPRRGGICILKGGNDRGNKIGRVMSGPGRRKASSTNRGNTPDIRNAHAKPGPHATYKGCFVTSISSRKSCLLATRYFPFVPTLRVLSLVGRSRQISQGPATSLLYSVRVWSDLCEIRFNVVCSPY